MDLFIILMSVTFAVLVGCIVWNNIRKGVGYKELSVTLFFAAMVTAASILIVHRFGKFWTGIFWAIFFCSVDWLLVSFIVFLNKYCKYILFKFVSIWVFIGISLIDTIQIALNPWLGHCYEVNVMSYAGKLYYTTKGLLFFNLHLGWSYILVAILAAILISKTVYVQRFYKVKYVGVLLCMTIVVVADGIYLVVGGPVDFTSIGFSIAAIAVFYITMIQTPKSILSKTIVLTLGQMQQAIMIVDDREEVVFLNDLMKVFVKAVIGVEARPDMRGTYSELFREWCKENYQNPNEDFVFDLKVKLDEDNEDSLSYYTMTYKKVYDEKNKLICSYFVIVDKTKEILKVQEQRKAATHDSLTGIYNRERFVEQCANTLAMHGDERYVMVVANVHKFKMVNEVFGKTKADEMLKRIGVAMRMNAKSGDVYGRLVADKFAYFLTKKNYRELTFIAMPAQVVRIDNEVSYPFPCYIGVYEIDDNTLPVELMIQRAIMAEESVKGNYNKRLAYYSDSLKAQDRIEAELLETYDKEKLSEQIEMHLQPVCHTSGYLLGAEAYMRWNHPTLGLLTPDKFMAAFDRNSKIIELDEIIWDKACAKLAEWKAMGKEHRMIAINAATKNFYFTDVYSRIENLVKKYDINPHNLVIEIREEAILADFPKQSKLVARLRKFGCQVIFDKFVNEGALFNLMGASDVDGVKICLEQAYVGENKERFMEMMMGIAKLNEVAKVNCAATYVADQQAAKMLEACGCQALQGEIFGLAVPEDEFEAKYGQ